MLKKTFSLIIFCCLVLYFSFLDAVQTPPYVLLNEKGEHFDLSKDGGLRPYNTPWSVYTPNRYFVLEVDRQEIELSLQDLLQRAFSQWSSALSRQGDPGLEVSFARSGRDAIFSVYIEHNRYAPPLTARPSYPNNQPGDMIRFNTVSLNEELSRMYVDLTDEEVISDTISVNDFVRECMYVLTESALANMFSMSSSESYLINNRQLAEAPVVSTNGISSEEANRPSIVFRAVSRSESLDYTLDFFILAYRVWITGGTETPISENQWNRIHEIGDIDGRTLAHLRQTHIVPRNVDPRRFVTANQSYCYGRYNLSCEQIERY